MKITIIGTGYVGLTEGLCFANCGHQVTCVDIDEEKIAKLQKGTLTLFEVGAEQMLRQNLKKKRIEFTTDLEYSLKGSKVIMICVNTPENVKDGSADLTAIFKVIEEIAKKINENEKFILVTRSTVPTGTNRKIQETLKKLNPKLNFEIVSNPEFSKQGTAIDDFLKPNRIIIGVENSRSKKIMDELYKPITKNGYPIFFCNIETAELIKYASNAFLAAKVGFINEMADLCEKTGADVQELATAMGMDKRISPYFLQAGPGMGGSCFPKDTMALTRIGDKLKVNLSIIKAVVESNKKRRKAMAYKIIDLMGGKSKGKVVSLLGATFKAGTDDTRYSPSIYIIERLAKNKVFINLYDPYGLPKMKTMLSKRALKRVKFCEDAYEASQDANILVIATEWSEFKRLDYKKIFVLLKNKVILDLRNLLDRDIIKKIGFNYFNIGKNDFIRETKSK
jgi:UDPglucose 6-dehydrogenase